MKKSETNDDLEHIRRAVELALEAERAGNLPIGAVITLEGRLIAEAGNSILVPFYHPGRHAEMEALGRVPVELWPRSREMTLYTTLEPCLMCMGASVLHGLGRIRFGALDREGGAHEILSRLPVYYAEGVAVPQLSGPLMPDVCDPLYKRVIARFDRLPCGKDRDVTPNSD